MATFSIGAASTGELNASGWNSDSAGAGTASKNRPLSVETATFPAASAACTKNSS